MWCNPTIRNIKLKVVQTSKLYSSNCSARSFPFEEETLHIPPSEIETDGLWSDCYPELTGITVILFIYSVCIVAHLKPVIFTRFSNGEGPSPKTSINELTHRLQAMDASGKVTYFILYLD